VLGAVTAALIASRAFTLPPSAAVAAMGITGSQGAGLLESYEDGTYVKTLHPGWAAHCGIVAAHLAEAGFTGPATVLEGRFGIFRSHIAAEQDLDFSVITRGLGRKWHALDTAFKPYPCAHAIHPYVDAILALRREEGLCSKDVSRILLPVVPSQHPIICEPRGVKLRPLTPTHARASLFFAVAAALEHGELGTDAYEESGIRDRAVLALAERIEHVDAPATGSQGHFSGEVVVQTRDGRELFYRQEHSLGTVGNPMDRGALEAKFRRNAGRCLRAKRVQGLVERLRELRTLTNVTELLKECHPQ
jgi:2-methylcitrate dehydratase PrpD